MVAQPRRCAQRIGAAQGAEPPDGDRARPLERPRGIELGQRFVDQRAVHAARAELQPQARGPVAARRAGHHPLPRERGVVQVATRAEVGDDRRRDVFRRAPPAQPAGELGARPRPAGQEIGGDQPCAARIEGRTPGLQDRAKGLAGPAGGAFAAPFSKVSSPVEKIPRTLRSKSSGLVAVSLAVSYAMTPSR